MDGTYIRPFLDSLNELFKTMLHCEPQRMEIRKSSAKIEGCEIVGLIGLTGRIRGTVALILPQATAQAAVSRFIGMEADEEEMVTDGVSELVNIVAGAAKAKFGSNGGEPIDLSLPNVITGSKSTVLSPSWSTWAEIAFNSELGPFSLRVTMEQRKEAS